MAEYIIDMPDDYLINEWNVYYPDERDDPMPIGEAVVRCRDCERFVTNIHGSYCKKSISTTIDPNGFCAWATRKESE